MNENAEMESHGPHDAVFDAGTHLRLLWSWWRITTVPQYLLSLLTVVCAGIVRRALANKAASKLRVAKLRASKAVAVSGDVESVSVGADDDSSNDVSPLRARAGRTEEPRSTSRGYIASQTARPAIPVCEKLELVSLHTLSFAVAYLLMLVAMTFNVGLFLAVATGEAVGFWLFDCNVSGAGLCGGWVSSDDVVEGPDGRLEVVHTHSSVKAGAAACHD
jgi:hypothetical protein